MCACVRAGVVVPGAAFFFFSFLYRRDGRSTTALRGRAT